jgi:hypothetical protein
MKALLDYLRFVAGVLLFLTGYMLCWAFKRDDTDTGTDAAPKSVTTQGDTSGLED